MLPIHIPLDRTSLMVLGKRIFYLFYPSLLCVSSGIGIPILIYSPCRILTVRPPLPRNDRYPDMTHQPAPSSQLGAWNMELLLLPRYFLMRQISLMKTDRGVLLYSVHTCHCLT